MGKGCCWRSRMRGGFMMGVGWRGGTDRRPGRSTGAVVADVGPTRAGSGSWSWGCCGGGGVRLSLGSAEVFGRGGVVVVEGDVDVAVEGGADPGGELERAGG